MVAEQKIHGNNSGYLKIRRHSDDGRHTRLEMPDVRRQRLERLQI
jgi:hypothetical protein